jgi:hypothetical protein
MMRDNIEIFKVHAENDFLRLSTLICTQKANRFWQHDGNLNDGMEDG